MAIYIGVEAEKVRKERNELKKTRDAKNAEMGMKNMILKRLNEVKADLQDLEFLSLQADAATQNLVTVWNALHLYVRTSKEQSDMIKDALKVSLLAYHFDEVVEPWKYIQSDADALYAVFAEADEEIKKLPRSV
jgi:seryl-tRNA synthetase